MSQFVLVHGSWHDGSAWQPVVDYLESKGHKAFAPTVAGHGKNVSKAVNHAQSVQSIVDFIVKKDLRDVVLVGHSYGGTIISKAVEQLPERVKRLVFWNAFVLADGECLNDNVPPHYRTLFAQLIQQSPDRAVMLPFPVFREAFMNDADLEAAQQAYAQLSSEPDQFDERLDMKKFYEIIRSGRVACSYLNGLEDTALPPGEWGWHPRMSSRLGLYRLVQMSASHEAIYSNPDLLARKILEAGRD
ncbi:MAG TPA: alpha/beta hydrolase [Nevskiaceae bacterium]